MYENAKKIFDYLPIRRDKSEQDYIEHLWKSYTTLDEGNEFARPFAVMPFHLLFMLAIQYKVLRISKMHKKACEVFFCGVAGRNKRELLSDKVSVFDIAFINERTIPEIFQLIHLEHHKIKAIKSLVDDRNDRLAHAKGGIEQNLENKLDLYFQALEDIQQKFKDYNSQLATDWIRNNTEEAELDQLLENMFLLENIAPKDFSCFIVKLLKFQKLSFQQWKQWDQILNKGLELAHDQTISTLREFAENENDEGRKLNAIRILEENGEIDIK